MPHPPVEGHTPSPETTASPRRRRGRLVVGGLIGLAAVAALVAGCSGSPESGTAGTTAPESGEAPAADASAVGAWGRDSPGQPRLELVADGSFSGTDGCNRLMGSWTQDEQTVEFTGVGSTRMACPDVDTWLERLHSARIDGDALHIRAADGVEIGTLDREG